MTNSTSEGTKWSGGLFNIGEFKDFRETNNQIKFYTAIGGYSAIVILSIILSFFWLLLFITKQQPIRSRGIVPVVVLFLKCVVSVSQVVRFTVGNEEISCFLESFLGWPLTWCLLCIITVQSYRYLFRKKINEFKSRRNDELHSRDEDTATSESASFVDQFNDSDDDDEVGSTRDKNAHHREQTTTSTLDTRVRGNSINGETNQNTMSMASSVAFGEHMENIEIEDQQRLEHFEAMNNDSIKKTVRVFRIVMSPYFIIFTIGACMLFWYMILLATIVSVSVNGYSSNLSEGPVCYITSQVTYLIVIIYSLVMVVIFLLCMYIDMGPSMYDLLRRCKVKKIFQEEDVYYFRSENIMFTSIITMFLIIIVAISLIIPSNLDFLHLVVQLIFYDFFTLAIIPGYSIALSLVSAIQIKRNKWKFKKLEALRQKESDNAHDKEGKLDDVEMEGSLDEYLAIPQTIDLILKTEPARSLFRNYCKQEFSMENIFLLDHVRRYKRISFRKQKKRFAKAKRIYHNFLTSKGELEVNVTKPVKNSVLSHLESFAKDQRNFPLKKGVFKEAEKGCKINLVDTYDRFFNTPQYQKFIKSRKNKD